MCVPAENVCDSCWTCSCQKTKPIQSLLITASVTKCVRHIWEHQTDPKGIKASAVALWAITEKKVSFTDTWNVSIQRQLTVQMAIYFFKPGSSRKASHSVLDTDGVQPAGWQDVNISTAEHGGGESAPLHHSNQEPQIRDPIKEAEAGRPRPRDRTHLNGNGLGSTPRNHHGKRSVWEMEQRATEEPKSLSRSKVLMPAAPTASQSVFIHYYYY